MCKQQTRLFLNIGMSEKLSCCLKYAKMLDSTRGGSRNFKPERGGGRFQRGRTFGIWELFWCPFTYSVLVVRVENRISVDLVYSTW